MENKNLTAVNWLIKEISKDRVGKAIIQTLHKEFEQALKKEKEQIESAFYNGRNLYNDYEDDSTVYYNKTYNN